MKKRIKNIEKIFKANNGYARTKELLAQGVHPRDLRKMLDEGVISKVKNGLYHLSDVPIVSHQGFIDVSQAVPEGVICLLSALSYHELTTFNPSLISVAIQRGTWRPKIIYPPVEFYIFSKNQFEAGIEVVRINKQEVKIYSQEKTICDCFRYRNKIGLDVAKEGLNEYLKKKNRNIEKLLKFAEACRIKSLLQTWLNAMV